ncbi:ATP-binding protein [Sphingobacterium paludis]|uniref:ATPase family protein associated with various cellular activities (AAA) n=1 Tax=Sphingobacterium paludis TaxID=1476465 RepID=A0A4R7D0U3_9SPHI|nr:ATP-binding protein [Sphingobacterium paludis]TDS13115.1 ATPase family protein associated with various cellular activities (AAA) [Sphingobacterium paludis]
MNIVYEKPTIEKGTLPRPLALANKSFPYNDIADSRRFEELLYSIYKTKIENNTFDGFDEISLMTGVRDQGRDCVLIRDGKSYGLIQCKKYDKNYSKNDLGVEITRFVLFSILEKTLVHDRSDFTYYISVSKGFTADCSEFIDDFNKLAPEDSSLSDWIAKGLSMPMLKSLALSIDHDDVKSILSEIKVKKIVPQDLDRYLSTPALNHLIPLFFEVRTVTDNVKLDNLIQKLGYDLSKEEVSKKLKSGSVSLNSEKKIFDDIKDSHLPRKETDDLYNWIISEKESETKEIQNVCLLVGQAGYGKTVILKDLYDKCNLNGIPVLGLKADKLYTYTLDGLQKSLGFPIPVNEFIETCKKYHKKTVILIDQIDALSQSMASDRKYLNVFRSFIDQFTKDNSVRIIISIRPYELYYDPSLRIYKNMPTFELKPLSESEVLSVISKIKIKKEDISPKLFELLKIPNHLNIFIRVVAEGGLNLQATSVQSLYLELWNNKVVNLPSSVPVQRTNLKTVLYKIADQMFSTQRITVSSLKFEDDNSEIKYLVSERLLKSENKQLQFFHQSFYDFVFAKQFVENTQDIVEYIKKSEQSIHIRPALKMIVLYLRDYDETQYEDTIKLIFEDQELLFHIKHVLFSLLISQNDPSKSEIDLVKELIQKSIHLQLMFFELAVSTVWFELAEKEGLLNVLKSEIIEDADFTEDLIAYRRKVVFFFLRNHIVTHNAPNAWLFLKSVQNDKIVQDLLYSVEDWSNPISYELFERCKDFEKTDPYGFYHVLDNIAKRNEDYAVEILSKLLPVHFEKSKSDKDYEEKEVLKTLAKKCPHKLYPIFYNCIEIDLKREVEYEQSIIRDWKYNNVDLNDKDTIFGSEFIYQLLAICLKRTAKSYPEHFVPFFERAKNSKYQVILQLLLFSLNGNEEQHYDKVFIIFQKLFESGLIGQDSDMDFELRTLVEKAFKYFKPNQRDYVILKIKGYVNRYEIRFHEYGEPRKKHFHSIWGLAKYYWLLRLPTEVVSVDKELSRSLQELERRFPDRKEKRRSRSAMAGVIHSPISAKAHQYMSNEQWLKAFRKYNDNPKRWGEDYLKGGLDELVSSFYKVVQEDPSDYKLKLIEKVLEDGSINIKYAIYGLSAWTEKRSDSKEKTISLFKAILKRELGTETRLCVDIASHLIGDKDNDDELIRFLTDQALDFKNYKRTTFLDDRDEKTTTINGLITAGINTTFGSAIRVLLHIKDDNYKDVIFNTVKNVLVLAPPEARAVVYWRFAYLLHLDQKRAYELFTEYINLENDIYIIASSLWSLQYMRNNGLDILSQPYEKLINSNLMGKDDSYLLFSILYGSYLHDQIGSRDLLLKHLHSSTNISSRMIGDILKYYYEVPNTKEKNDELLAMIIEQVSEDDEVDMTLNFINVEHIKIDDIYGFLGRYISSSKFKLSEYFMKYLIHQCGRSVHVAIDVFNLALNKQSQADASKQLYHHRSDEAAIKFVVGAYDCLHGNDSNSKAKRMQLLLSFDQILKDYRLRRSADNVLEKII